METAQPRHSRSVLSIALIAIIIIAVLAGSFYYIESMQGAFQKHVKVGIVTWTQDTFWGPTQQGATDAARELGVDLTFVKSEPDIQSQNKHIHELLDDGVQGLAISPNDPRAQQQVIDDAAGKAVVITFDSDAPDTKRRGYVGTDDYSAGQIAADEVRSAVPGGGDVIICVASIDMSNGRERRQGVIDNLLDRPFRQNKETDAVTGDLKGKKYSIVATVLDHHNMDDATKLVTAAIAAHPNVKCVVGLFSYNGHAIVKAIQAAGKQGQIKVIGFDESLDEQADVASGAIYSSILQNQYQCGYEIVRDLADICRGVAQNGPSGPWLTALPVVVMRKDNLDELRKKHTIRTAE